MVSNEELTAKQDELNSLLLEIVKSQKRSYKNLVVVFAVTIVCLSVIICTIVGCFTWYESQFETGYVTTETVEQEVSGENSNINNISGNQYNDNAVHNEGE